MRIGTSFEGRLSAAIVLALWLLLIGLGVVFVSVAPPGISDPETIRAFFLGFGLLAPVAFVLVQAAQVVVAPLPGQVLGFVGGYLFGAVWGTGFSLLGATLGTYAAVWLARRYGRPAVERLVHPDTVDRFDAAVDRHGLVALFVVFLVPGLPDDAICLAAGLTRLEVRWILVVSVVGRLPGYALVATAGAQLAGGRPTDTVVLLGIVVAVSVAVYLRRDTVLRWLSDAPERTGR